MSLINTFKDQPKIYIVVLSIISVVIFVNETKMFISTLTESGPLAWVVICSLFLSFVFFGVRKKIWR